MAKRYTELWPQIADKDNVHKGLHLAVKNKRKVGSIARVLEDAGVYKHDETGRMAFKRFVEEVGIVD